MIRRTYTAPDGTESEALYSDCDRYRYALTRIWQAQGKRLLIVMLNPSKATERHNDPTIERCERRARALGYGGVRVCNLFAWRETDPRALKRATTPVGPECDAVLSDAAIWSDDILCGWGVHGAHMDRGAQVARQLAATGKPLLNLGLSKAGHPRHPLYIAYAQQPVVWESDQNKAEESFDMPCQQPEPATFDD